MTYTPIEQAIITYLLSQSSISSLVGSRIYMTAPRDRTYPYVYVTSAGTEYVNDLAGSSGAASQRLRFSVVSTSFLDVANVQEQIRLALHDFTGTLSGVQVIYCMPEDGSEQDFPTKLPDGSGNWAHLRSFDYTVSYRITIP